VGDEEEGGVPLHRVLALVDEHLDYTPSNLERKEVMRVLGFVWGLESTFALIYSPRPLNLKSHCAVNSALERDT
jgi:hypothetical protein